MKCMTLFLVLNLLSGAVANSMAQDTTDSDPSAKILLEDDFDREESDPAKEEVGNGWGTNSKSRAKGVKQVDLVDGAMHVTMAAVADHGVSVHHEVAFRDAVIQMRFKLGAGDDLGINIADMKEKSVHAGHICVARIKPKMVEISDLKTGTMKLEHRQARKEKKVSAELSQLLKSKTKKFDVNLTLNEWHTLQVQIKGDVMSVTIDDKPVGAFESAGIGHSTKSRLRLSVNKTAWVDDVKISG